MCGLSVHVMYNVRSSDISGLTGYLICFFFILDDQAFLLLFFLN